MKLTIVIPTYNEADNLPHIVPAILSLSIPQVEISVLVVDDNSPDGTGELADELAAEFPQRVQVLHRQEKNGLGQAYIDGFAVALQGEADAILQMDADFSHQPHYISEMITALDGCDFVVGSRFSKGGRVDENWAWWRKLLSWFANSVYVRLLLRTPIRDATGGFKLWRRETLLGMDIAHRIRSNGYVFQVEMNYVALKLGYQAVEIPIYFPDRTEGESKMSFHIQYEAAARVFQVWWRHRRLTAADRAI
jgi:dolichol-phosphate mannosyltransferase